LRDHDPVVIEQRVSSVAGGVEEVGFGKAGCVQLVECEVEALAVEVGYCPSGCAT